MTCLTGSFAGEVATLSFSPGDEDATEVVREALEAVEASHVVLIFEPGRYEFGRDKASEQYLAITNHDNGLKRVIFPMDRFESVKIEGNGAEFIFQGRVLPFLFKGCKRVEVSGLTIDWDVPLYFQATVKQVNSDAGWIDVEPFKEGFSWSVRRERLLFPDIEGFSYSHMGETLAFDPAHRRVAHGAWDMHLDSPRVEQHPDGQLRIHARSRHYPDEGNVIVSKGKMGENRYAPAIYGVRSSNILIKDVTLHHAPGMGFLFERCDTVTLSDCGAFVRPDSNRMVSLLADATHFCNCKGEVLIENSRFQHMLDDGTNVHGAYVVVDEVLDDHSVRVKLMHFQQAGFHFADPGDQVWLIHAPDPSRGQLKTVNRFRQLNETYSVITFEEPLGKSLKDGDLLENKTWNPSFTMRGCTIKDHRARSVVLKTPLPVLIEDNTFSSMMSTIFLRGESWFWFESGSVEDVLIQNNRFEYCAYSGMEHAVLRVTPRLGRQFDASSTYDRNIRFVGNQVHTFGNRIVWAERVEGLEILQNTIMQTNEAPVLHPGSPMIELTFCRNARIESNTYEGENTHTLSTDETSAATLTLIDNDGFPQHP
ncbi:right-handed parallel beta-helix repeat-containing protein [Puniceicoccales bacterium CK1056]|uniref:Right-handed parallel beta-helix repeat-containing protein n=1 Tax=Oceanipulchritudo coccoides TaxID=2706888 RepID=A0A6B2M0K4_9BACT|nr:right-handed parallel beta-helix repeat-containing protein [Oceanipulchritudo coccoides]NDV61557.1 right-handed parallel beta-helix repeat-containing protein [Oceanipulchritudo coccoides]